MILALLGDTDCEEIGDGFLNQPSNTASSLAFVLAGTALVTCGARRTSSRGEAVAFGVALIVAGVGSADFHGTASPVARLVHDAGLAAVLAYVLLHGVARLPRLPFDTRYVHAAGLAAIALVVAAWPSTGTALGLVLAAAIVLTEAAWHGWGRHWTRGARRRHVTAYRVAATLIVGGVAVNWLSRTDGPLCDPGSPLQGHALWHVLAASAALLWGWAASESGAESGGDR